MKKIVLVFAKYSGLFWLSGLLTRKELRILCYHGTWMLDGHYGNHLFISPGKFAQRMAWLAGSKYRVIPLEEGVDRLNNGGFQPNSVVITIDDGWFGTYRDMVPSLSEHALPATLYAYTSPIETQRPLYHVLVPALIALSPVKTLELEVDGPRRFDLSDPKDKANAVEQISASFEQVSDEDARALCRTLADKLGFDGEAILASRQFSFMTFEELVAAERDGLDIQLHTHTHHLDVRTPETVASEVKINREKLTPYVHSSLQHFCYPSGVHSEAMYGYLRDSGVRSATLVDSGLVQSDSPTLVLKRLLDGEQVSQLEFEAELSGFLDILRRFKSRQRGSTGEGRETHI